MHIWHRMQPAVLVIPFDLADSFVGMVLAQMPDEFEKRLARQSIDCLFDFPQLRQAYNLSSSKLGHQTQASTGPRPCGRGIGLVFEPLL